MRTIRWGMIGCGVVTEKKSGPGFYKARNSALVAVMSLVPGEAESYARRHGVPKFYLTAEELLADPDVDAVYVATPPAFHKQYALKAAEAGKIVYVEKPMALRYAEGLEVIAFCKEKGVPLFVPFYRRAMDRFIAIKNAVDSGEIGKPLTVEVMLRKPPTADEHAEKKPWRLTESASGGGWFVDMGLHTVDFLMFCFGDISSVRAFADNKGGLYEVEDTVTATWLHESGVTATGTWNFASADAEDSVLIVGSRGTLSFPFFSDAEVLIKGAGGERRIAIADPEHVQMPFIQSVVDELNGIGRCPGTAESAARASWFADEVLAEYRSRKGFRR